ncbi:MAG: response regulator [Opitutae bacterium]|nr:response regulator [Opitutae bacterium]
MKILHLEDDPADAELVRHLLVAEWPAAEITVVADRNDFLAALRRETYDAVLSDFKLPGFGGLEALQHVRQLAPELPFVFISGTIGEDQAIETMHAGADDYVLKDNLRRLLGALRRTLRERDSRQQRRAAEASLRASEERFRLVARATTDAVWDWNLATDERWWSGGHQGLFGYPPDPHRRGIAAWTDHLHPEDHARVTGSISAVLNGPASDWAAEYRYRRADGSYADVYDRGHVLRDAAGRPYRMVGSMQDLTGRKQAERRVHELAAIIDKAPVAIIITDLGHRVTYWNKGAELMFGWARAEALGHLAEDLFPAEAALALAAGRAAAPDHGEWRGEIPLTTRDGRSVAADFSLSLIRDEAGQPLARLSISTDITEKKKLAEQFLRAQRMESIGMLASGIAHDLNNVLAPILMTAPLLRDHLTSAEDLHILHNLEKSAERGAALVRQILGFIQGVGGEARPIQIKHLVRDIADVALETFPKSITIATDLPGDLWLVQANPSQIHQVLLNLCVNARDAMPRGGKLTLAMHNSRPAAGGPPVPASLAPGPTVVITVSDTGTGIPPDVLEKIWDPFYTTKAPTKGTGLGLSTTRGIIESLGGSIAVETALGAGTTFTVSLPALEATVARDSAQPFALAPTCNNELILIIDDETHIRDVARATLVQFGYRVLLAPDGAEAVPLYAARAADIALVITDLNMPNLDGLGFAQIARQMKPDVKIILSSGFGSSHHLGEARRLCEGFLQKPFTVEELLRQVHQVLHPKLAG